MFFLTQLDSSLSTIGSYKLLLMGFRTIFEGDEGDGGGGLATIISKSNLECFFLIHQNTFVRFLAQKVFFRSNKSR